MVGFILRRFLSTIPLLIGISIVSFIIIQLPPGDFATAYQNQLVTQGNMPVEDAQKAADAYRKLYGLDKASAFTPPHASTALVTIWRQFLPLRQRLCQGFL